MAGRHAVQGWPSGTPANSADTPAFSMLSGVQPMIEAFRSIAPPRPVAA